MDIDLVATRLVGQGKLTFLRLYRLLMRVGVAGVSMDRIEDRLGTLASTLSHHGGALIEVGRTVPERAGTWLICRAKDAAMRGLIDDLAAECCADAGPAR